jgi:histidinol dehydrogenase
VSARLDLRRLDTTDRSFDASLDALTAFEIAQDPAIDAAVASIVADVRLRKDAAVLDYTRRFDRVDAKRIADLEIDAAAMRAAHEAIDA